MLFRSITDMSRKRELLKEMILHLHRGETPEEVKKQLTRMLGEVPYGIVVGIEQELIQEGLPTEEVLKLCDIHGKALKGIIDLKDSRSAPAGHPIDTFKNENAQLKILIERIRNLLKDLSGNTIEINISDALKELRLMINSLFDVDKHYRRKENLLFPYLEKKGITGPPTVMWAKHDETRKLLAAARDAIINMQETDSSELQSFKESAGDSIIRAMDSVDEMIIRLLPNLVAPSVRAAIDEDERKLRAVHENARTIGGGDVTPKGGEGNAQARSGESGRKIGRNEVVTITNGAEKKRMKYKKAIPILEAGAWRIIE